MARLFYSVRVRTVSYTLGLRKANNLNFDELLLNISRCLHGKACEHFALHKESLVRRNTRNGTGSMTLLPVPLLTAKKNLRKLLIPSRESSFSWAAPPSRTGYKTVFLTQSRCLAKP